VILTAEGYLVTPRTDAQLVDLRRSATDAGIVEGYPVSSFTCDGCVRAPRCQFVYDPYNQDGDCLDDK
jgi:hypothetical protein